MKTCVVGVGYVGLVSAACLAEAGNRVICVDKDEQKIRRLREGEIPIYEPGLTELVIRNSKVGRLRFTTHLKEGIDDSEIIILAVGTPSAEDGSVDMTAVESVVLEIARHLTDYRVLVTKSTVPVGTHQRVSDLIRSHSQVPFDYVSNPEFLKEGAAVEDFMSPDRIIIGTDSERARDAMKRLYGAFMRKSNRILFMDPASAEMAKYASNTMLAARISLMNEVSALCEKVGADIEMVRRGVGSDSRIGSAFLFPGVGFGGSCFPKDVRALIHAGAACGLDMTLARSVQSVNAAQQQRFAQRVVDYFASRGRPVRLAVWGLAFKARTDDVRESPAITCIRRFLDEGMTIRAYDPEANAPARQVLDGRIETVTESYDALEGADALVIFTDWQEFRNPDFGLIARKLRQAVIFDGRNLYDPAYLKQLRIEYHSIGRR
ncbi:MAG TPA: UDP-glucose/GDP-mannose dehydrogenase family protein [Sedimentisphaerales bacterium]|jgi:UDPglucose 6-dehydrogenase|nr:UDP-glucose/GDP-mannose dehydrogenase family protein [Sedimentisphaerales bacterium]HNU29170.1 UDP-glucose/GDP-mannose dehydrogenase family protein [Sedimentisphaerales bacterium]